MKADALVRLGAEMLAQCFEALGSSVSCDRRRLSSVASAWPDFTTDLACGDDEPRRRYNARQLRVAEHYCQVFVAMSQFTHSQKKAALEKALRPTVPWRKIGKRVGLGWQQARDAYESVVVSFAYEIASVEGVDLEELKAL